MKTGGRVHRWRRLKSRQLSHSQHGATLIHHIAMIHDDVCDFNHDARGGVDDDRMIMMSLLAGRQTYTDKGQNLLWAIKCKQTSRGCEFTTGNDHYLKGYQTQMELERKLLRKRNPGVKHQSMSTSSTAPEIHMLIVANTTLTKDRNLL